MTLSFAKASKQASFGRMALIGPSGSGKTYTALRIGTAIAKAINKPIAVIDSERGSASKYSDKFAFDVLNLPDFSPQTYIQAMRVAEQNGYGVVIVDSLSHAWAGKGGALEMVDAAAARQGGRGNNFSAWREVTPVHNELVDTMLTLSAHLLVTMRAKTEYVQEKDERGKTVIRKIGLQPVQRDGLEYEFDVVADVDIDHKFIISKTRCEALDGKMFLKAGEDVAGIFHGWLSDGAAAPTNGHPKPLTIDRSTAQTPAIPDTTGVGEITDGQLTMACRAYMTRNKVDAAEVRAVVLSVGGAERVAAVPPAKRAALLEALNRTLAEVPQ